MSTSEKDTESSYSLLPSDRSATSSDDLLYDGHLPGLAKRKFSRRSKLIYAVGGLALILAYSTFLVTATSMWWKKDRLHGANVIDCKSNTPYLECSLLTNNCSSPDQELHRI